MKVICHAGVDRRRILFGWSSMPTNDLAMPMIDETLHWSDNSSQRNPPIEAYGLCIAWLILSLLCLLCVKGGWLTRGRNETLQTHQELFGGISIANKEFWSEQRCQSEVSLVVAVNGMEFYLRNPLAIGLLHSPCDVCMSECPYVRMYYVCMSVCPYVRMYYVCMSVCTYVRMYYVYMSVCPYVLCMYVVTKGRD